MSLEIKKIPKGGNLNLSKEAPGSTTFRIGLGWDINNDSTIKHDFDIDVVGFLVDSTSGKGVVDTQVVFYNNVDGKGTDNSVYDALTPAQALDKAKELVKNSLLVVSKDNRTGEGAGDDETLFINPTAVPEGKSVLIAVVIYEADARSQVFGMVRNAHVNVYDDQNSQLLQYDLADEFALETGAVVAEFYKKDGALKFRALGKGFTGDLNKLISDYK